jgi:hypothetical protein
LGRSWSSILKLILMPNLMACDFCLINFLRATLIRQLKSTIHQFRLRLHFFSTIFPSKRVKHFLSPKKESNFLCVKR